MKELIITRNGVSVFFTETESANGNPNWNVKLDNADNAHLGKDELIEWGGEDLISLIRHAINTKMKLDIGIKSRKTFEDVKGKWEGGSIFGRGPSVVNVKKVLDNMTPEEIEEYLKTRRESNS